MFLKNFLAIVLFFAMSTTAIADEHDDKNLITVTGKAELQAVPDEVHVSFTIQKNDKTLKVAQDKNDEIASKILRVMKNRLGIEEKNIQTNFINVNPVYTYVRCNNNQVRSSNDNCNKQVFSHFETKKGIAVKLKDTDKLEELLQEAIDAGVTHINNVQFVSSKYEELLKKAQLIATKDAQKNAEAIADVLGVAVGKPYRINVSYYNQPPTPRHDMRAMAMSSVAESSGGSSISLGELNIKANVNAQFAID
jgi:uncharacterized protein YggE